jgi:hypothetical protein
MSHEMGNKIGKDERYLRPLRGETVDGQQVFLFGVSGYNEETVILTTGTLKSVSWTSSTQHNYGAEGMIIYWDIVAQSDTNSGTVCLFLDYMNPASLDFTAAWQTAYLSATGTVVGMHKYIILPGVVDDGSGFTSVDRIPVPLHWRMRVLHSASGTWEYNIGTAYVGA